MELTDENIKKASAQIFWKNFILSYLVIGFATILPLLTNAHRFVGEAWSYAIFTLQMVIAQAMVWSTFHFASKMMALDHIYAQSLETIMLEAAAELAEGTLVGDDGEVVRLKE